jgi:photosystem II stability/assembly factor-like uncharacterized protein
MKKHEYDDLLPEEAENQEFIQQLEQACQMMPEDVQSIGHIRDRWFKVRSSSRPLSLRGMRHSIAQETQKEADMMATIPTREVKPWTQTLNQMAAVLIVLLLVGTLVTTFALVGASRSGKQQIPTIPGGPGHAVIRSGVSLTEGLRLYMLDQQVGWAVGDGPTSDNTYGSVLRTGDSGKHWKDVTPPGLPGHDVSYLYILDAKTAWVPAWQNGIARWLYRTVDAGASWQRFAWPGEGNNVSSMTFVDQDNGWVVDTPQPKQPIGIRTLNPPRVAGMFSLLQTNDGGKTWKKVGPLTMPGRVAALQFRDQQTGWVTSVEGVLYITHDGGRSWKQQALLDSQGNKENARPGIITHPMFLHEQAGYLLTGDNSSPRKWSVYMTQDGGNIWKRSGGFLPDNVDTRTLLDARHISGGSLDASGNYLILLLTLTNGQWMTTPINQPSAQGGIVDFSFSSVHVGFALRQAAKRSFDVYQTNDGGKTWRKVGTFPNGG